MDTVSLLRFLADKKNFCSHPTARATSSCLLPDTLSLWDFKMPFELALYMGLQNAVRVGTVHGTSKRLQSWYCTWDFKTPSELALYMGLQNAVRVGTVHGTSKRLQSWYCTWDFKTPSELALYMGLQNAFRVGTVHFTKSLSPPHVVKEVSTGRKNKHPRDVSDAGYR